MQINAFYVGVFIFLIWMKIARAMRVKRQKSTQL